MATKKAPSNRDEEYRMPILPGQQVCLNPESKNYARLREYAGDKRIYMLTLKGADEGENWCRENINNLNGWYIGLIKEDGTILDAMYTDVLLLDAKPKDIVRYRFVTGGELIFFDGEANEEQKQRIFKENIRNTKLLNNEWRAGVLQNIANYYES